MAWWICGGCNEECFEPCDCFAKNCVLELTVSGWEDNASTDCGGIADLTFNGTHDIGGESLMSTLPYGYECELAYSFDQPVLTKEVGGNCICKDQPALYTIYASLQCGGEGPDEFLYTLHLDFHVPVYDEDEGCSPAPCAVEPKWEIWTAEPIVLYEGPLSGNPVCKFDIGPIDIAWAASPSAQTTCGLGLDGTNITVSARMKLCDAVSPDCSKCCNENLDQLPDSVQVVISGMANGQIGTPNLGEPCDDCPSFDGTYVLERGSNDCVWGYRFAESPCATGIPIGGFMSMLLYVYNINGTCNWQLRIFITPSVVLPERYEWLYAAFCDNGDGYAANDTCSGWNATVLNECTGEPAWCDYTGATATITAI